MQAQDYAAAKWAIGMRLDGATEASVEAAFNRGEILRTHVMRPTWHFVTPEDIRWMLALTAPRVHAYNGNYYRRSGLNEGVFKRSNAVLEKALEGARQLTRGEIDRELLQAGIRTRDYGLSYTLMRAELDGVICSGPRRGKQFTYMLLEDRVPQAEPLDRDEALASLTRRYFTSHGPAQVRDFTWWSGLTQADARRGLEMNGEHLAQEEVDGKVYWFSRAEGPARAKRRTAFLVPGFDEYFIAYQDRSAILDPKYAKHLNLGGGMVNGAVIAEGRMVGGWKRTFEKAAVCVSIQLYEEISPAHEKGIQAEAERFGRFLGMPVRLQ